MTSQAAVAALPSGVHVFRAPLPTALIDAVRRAMYVHVGDHGLPPRAAWPWTHDPFVDLRASAAVCDLANHVQHVLGVYHSMLLPPHQLVWHLPDLAPSDLVLEPHVDVPPPGLHLRLIVGVAFSPWTASNGTVRVWPGPCPVELAPGEAFAMQPHVPHSPGINRSSAPREGVYFRWAEPA